MDENQFEKILTHDEGSNLDFKREIDLESKRGKADFLVEVLGLANAPSKPSYLIIGLEDKTRKVVGIPEDITEERIQQILSEHCRPPINCIFEVRSYERKRIGVLSILGKRRPYILKTELGYQDEKGRQNKISDKQVFVRRGSTGDIATPDEIIEMAVNNQTDMDNQNNLSNVDIEFINLYKSEYEKVKQEQIQRIGFRHNIIYAILIAIIIIVSIVLDGVTRTPVLLVLPLVCVTLGWTYLINNEKISAISRYIRTRFIGSIRELLKSDDWGLLGWEVEYRSDNRRISRKIIQLFIDEFVFVLSGLMFIVIFWLISPTNFLWLRWMAALEALFLLVLGWLIFSYSDLHP